MQKIGVSYVKSYKYELLRHMTDIEDAAAWLIVWSLPVGKLTVALRCGRALDLGDEAFAPVFAAGSFFTEHGVFLCYERKASF